MLDFKIYGFLSVKYHLSLTKIENWINWYLTDNSSFQNLLVSNG